MTSALKKKRLFLFDVDGTLTPARKVIDDSMLEMLRELKKSVAIGFVGGSDMAKQQEQLKGEALSLFDYSFSENGLNAYKEGKLIYQGSFIEYLGEEKYQKLVNFILRAIADTDIPKKRGTFIEFRQGMVNVSPIGRNCSYEERLEFEAIDKKQGIRRTLIEKLEAAFPDFNLKYSIGGQISIDIFPKGWDKTFCLKHLEGEGFEEIHFFGDKTSEGGNDYEIYHHPSIIGHAITSPQNTIETIQKVM